jgi:hypothetical protein
MGVRGVRRLKVVLSTMRAKVYTTGGGRRLEEFIALPKRPKRKKKKGVTKGNRPWDQSYKEMK